MIPNNDFNSFLNFSSVFEVGGSENSEELFPPLFGLFEQHDTIGAESSIGIGSSGLSAVDFGSSASDFLGEIELLGLLPEVQGSLAETEEPLAKRQRVITLLEEDDIYPHCSALPLVSKLLRVKIDGIEANSGNENNEGLFQAHCINEAQNMIFPTGSSSSSEESEIQITDFAIDSRTDNLEAEKHHLSNLSRLLFNYNTFRTCSSEMSMKGLPKNIPEILRIRILQNEYFKAVDKSKAEEIEFLIDLQLDSLNRYKSLYGAMNHYRRYTPVYDLGKTHARWILSGHIPEFKEQYCKNERVTLERYLKRIVRLPKKITDSQEYRELNICETFRFLSELFWKILEKYIPNKAELEARVIHGTAMKGKKIEVSKEPLSEIIKQVVDAQLEELRLKSVLSASQR